MKPAIVYHPDEPTWRHLVDLDSVTVINSREDGNLTMHYMAAVEIQDLKPGQWRFRSTERNGSIPKSDGSYEHPAKPIGPEIITMWRMSWGVPYPSVFAQVTDHHKKMFSDSEGRELTPNGITRPAAVAMLKLASSHNNTTVKQAKGKWSFDGPAMEDVEAPWSDWKFLAAWMWSKWENQQIATGRKVSIRDRWKEMQLLGYPHKERAFSVMVKSLFR